MERHARVFPMVYLNGDIIPIENAHISVLDRGFLFGDAIYEVVPVYSGKLFRGESHITRLMNGLAEINIQYSDNGQPANASTWRRIFAAIASANGGGDMSIYLQVSRGAGPYRDHLFPADTSALVFALCQRLTPRAQVIVERGADAILLEDTRWARCNIKSTSLLANVLLRQSAVEQDAVEAVLHKDGYVTEGAASSIMIVKNGILICTPDSAQILPGTTRRLVIELADQIDVPCQIHPFSVEDLLSADEVCLSAATKDITPVCRIDQRTIGEGVPGPVWRRLDCAYQQYKQDFINSGNNTSAVAL